MLHTDARFSQAVADAVAEVERTTDAEVVVVAAERSATYADISARAASVCALLTLAVMLYMPYHLAEHWVIIDLAVCWLLFERLFRLRVLQRLLTTEARRTAEVHAAAEREFHREVVHGTPNRSGVLVYVSALEGAVEVLPDLGVEGKVPRGELVVATRAFAHDDLEHFLQGLQDLGTVLAKYVPHTDESDDIDLPNAPRIRR